MLKTNDIQINKINLTETNISVTLEDPEVHPEQYTFFKKRLKTYKLYINNEYAFKSQMKYEEPSQLLNIRINIIIPNMYMPSEPEKANEILMDPINTFQIFYDAQNEIYNRKLKIS